MKRCASKRTERDYTRSENRGPKREVIAADTRVSDEGEAEERLRVEGANDEDGSVVFLACAVEFVAHVDRRDVVSAEFLPLFSLH